MRQREVHLPGSLCRGCDQAPHKMKGSAAATVFALACRLRFAVARLRRREPLIPRGAIQPEPSLAKLSRVTVELKGGI